MPKNKPFFFDIETGGLNPQKSSILSISFGQQPEKVESLYARPARESFLSKWSEKNVWDKIRRQRPVIKSEEQVLKQFLGRLESLPAGAEVIGWNIGYTPEAHARGFDIPTLISRAEKYGLKTQYQQAFQRANIRDVGQEFAYRMSREISSGWEHLVRQGKLSADVFGGVRGYAKLGAPMYRGNPADVARYLAEEGRWVAGWKQEVAYESLTGKSYAAHMSAADVASGIELSDLMKRKTLFQNEQQVVRWGRETLYHSLVSQGMKPARGGMDPSAKFSSLMSQAFEMERTGGVEYKGFAQRVREGLRTAAEERGGTLEQVIAGRGVRDTGRIWGRKLPITARPPAVSKWLTFAKKNPGIMIAGGVAALWALQPGSLFSGKDDEYNTIEGLPHGGEAQKMRRYLTDFGSGMRRIFGSIANLRNMTRKQIRQRLGKWAQEQKIINIPSRAVDAEGPFSFIEKATPALFKELRDEGITPKVLNEQVRGVGFDRTLFNKVAPATDRKDLAAFIYGHELSEIHHLTRKNITAGKEVSFGSHASSAVIADEMFLSAALGPDAYRAAKNFRDAEIANLNLSLSMYGESPEMWKTLGLGEVDDVARYVKRVTKIRDAFEKKHLHRFSGFDRAHNTIQGLQHGTGQVTSRANQKIPFGTGRIRGLLNAASDLASSVSGKVARTAKVAKWLNKEGNRAVGKITREIIHGAKQGQPLELATLSVTAAEGAHTVAEVMAAGALTPGIAASAAAGFVGTKYLYEVIKNRRAIKTAAQWARQNPEEAIEGAKVAGKATWKELKGYIATGRKTPAVLYMEAGGGEYGKQMLLGSLESRLGVSLTGAEKAISKMTMEDVKRLTTVRSPEELLEQFRIMGFDDAHNVIEGLSERGLASQLRKINTDFGSGYTRVIRTLFRGTGKRIIKHSAVFGTEAGVKLTPAQKIAEQVLERVRAAEFASRPSRMASTFWTPSAREAADYATGLGQSGVVSATRAVENTFYARQSLVTELNKEILSRKGDKKRMVELARSYWKGVDPSQLATKELGDIEALIPGTVVTEKAWAVEKQLKGRGVSYKWSGFDDAYNTIEGIRHGAGQVASRRGLKIPFGSGWNALRNLVHGSETFAEMIASKGFQQALKEAKRVRVLGEGFFGQVHEMRGVFRGQEFRFAQKVGEIGKDEIAAMRAVEETVGPTIYSTGQNRVAMELFEGKALGELEKAQLGAISEAQLQAPFKQLHQQGWTHGDPHLGNVMLVQTPSGPQMGLIDFGKASRGEIFSAADDLRIIAERQKLMLKYMDEPDTLGITGDPFAQAENIQGSIMAHMPSGSGSAPNSFSGFDDAFNKVEGLGEDGFAAVLRKKNTDMGSGWRGLRAFFSRIARPFTRAGKIERTYKGLIKRSLAAKGINTKGLRWDYIDDISGQNIDMTIMVKSASGNPLAMMSREFSPGKINLNMVEVTNKGSGLGKQLYFQEARALHKLGYKTGTEIVSPISSPITARWQTQMYKSVPTRPHTDQFFSDLANKKISKDQFQESFAGEFTGTLQPIPKTTKPKMTPENALITEQMARDTKKAQWYQQHKDAMVQSSQNALRPGRRHVHQTGKLVR